MGSQSVEPLQRRANLEQQLPSAGLPTDPRDIIGRIFSFERNDSTINYGTILSLHLMPGCIVLYVSKQPEYTGLELSGLSFHKGEWSMQYVKSAHNAALSGSRYEQVHGKFELL